MPLTDTAAVAAAAVLSDRITFTEPGEVGPNAVISTLLPRILRSAAIAAGDDGDAGAAGCCEQFARFAVHGGFATERGFTWTRPAVHLYGARTATELIAAAATNAGAGWAVRFARPVLGAGIELRIYGADGALVSEATGLGELRARLATGRPVLPVNSLAVGSIIDHRLEGTS